MLNTFLTHNPFRHRLATGSARWLDHVKSEYAGLIDFETPEKNPTGRELYLKLEAAYLARHPFPELYEMPDFVFTSFSNWEEELERDLSRRAAIIDRHETEVRNIRAAADEFARHGEIVVNWLLRGYL